MKVGVIIKHTADSSLAGQSQSFQKGVVKLGRRPDNDVVFDAVRDAVVSGRHAEIRSENGRVSLFDTGSANHVFLNGVQLGPEGATLNSGDTVMLGRNGPKMEVLFQEQPVGVAGGPAGRAVHVAAGAERQPPGAAGLLEPSPGDIWGAAGADGPAASHAAQPLIDRSAVPREAGSVPPLAAPVAHLGLPEIGRDRAPEAAGRPRPPHDPRRSSGSSGGEAWNSPASLIMQRTQGRQSIGLNTLMGVMNEVSSRDTRRVRRLIAGVCTLCGAIAIAIVLYVNNRPAPHTWAEVLDRHALSVYVVVMLEDGDPVGRPVGTAWSVRPGVLATNSHVSDLVLKSKDAKFVARSNCPNGEKPYDLSIVRCEVHPGYTAFNALVERYMIFDPRSYSFIDPVPQCDVGLLHIAEADKAKQAPPLKLAPNAALHELKGGVDAAFIGFPMEQFGQGGLNPAKPVAQLFTGGITRVTDPFLSPDAAASGRILISYQLIAAGGASGSPVFNHDGLVVGFISAGNVSGMNEKGRLDKSGTAYGPRVDLLLELLDGQAEAAQKARTDGWVNELRDRFAKGVGARVLLSKWLTARGYTMARQGGKLPAVAFDKMEPAVDQQVMAGSRPTRLPFTTAQGNFYLATAIADNPDARPMITMSAGAERSEPLQSGKYFTLGVPVTGTGREAAVELTSTGSGTVRVIVWRLPLAAEGQ